MHPVALRQFKASHCRLPRQGYIMSARALTLACIRIHHQGIVLMLIQMPLIPVRTALAARVSSVPPAHSAPVASDCGRVLDTGLLLSETGLSRSALHPVLRLDVWVGMYPQDQRSVAQRTCVVRISVVPARQGTSRQVTGHAGCAHQ